MLQALSHRPCPCYRPELECDLDLSQLEDADHPDTWKRHFNILLQDDQGALPCRSLITSSLLSLLSFHVTGAVSALY